MTDPVVEHITKGSIISGVIGNVEVVAGIDLSMGAAVMHGIQGGLVLEIFSFVILTQMSHDFSQHGIKEAWKEKQM